MNPAIALSLTAAVVGVLVALLSLRFGSAPGWRPYRTLALVAASAALYAACETMVTTDAPLARRLPLAQVQTAAAALNCAAWLAYVRRRLGGEPRFWELRLRDAALLIAALWLLPIRGLVLSDRFVSYDVDWLGVRYAIVQATAVGALSFVVLVAALAVSLFRCAQGARRGSRDALMHVVALGSIIVAAVSDALVASTGAHVPMLLSLSFLGAVGAMGTAFTNDFVASAREMNRVSGQLETMVEKRTAELIAAESALLRAEKMAAVGRLAAGVAHEINNPAGALAANLAYLNEGLTRGKLPPDAPECLAESEEAVARIAKIVAQLLDTSREVADPEHPDASVQLRPVVEAAVAMARPRTGSHVTTTVDVDAALWVRADQPSLVQVLVNVIVNAAQAIPAPRAGRIAIRAAKEGDRVRLHVEDNGAGMSPETERRMFDPFFTTKPHGQGTGLGLSVSLGIVRSMDGELQVSTSPDGTTVAVVLAAGMAAPVSRTRESAAPSAAVATLLVVDDDVAVARAVRRLLGSTMTVEVVTTVSAALAKLLEQPFDVILSDLQMPGGGGRWLYEELLAVSPGTARRVIFFSGGSPSAMDAELIARCEIPLLAKPLDVDELMAVARRVAAAAASSAA